jgi:hypothetical protein
VMDSLCRFLNAGPGLLFEYTPKVEGTDTVSDKAPDHKPAKQARSSKRKSK